MDETGRDPDVTTRTRGLSVGLAVLVAAAATMGGAAGAWGALTLSGGTPTAAQAHEPDVVAQNALPAEDVGGEDLDDLPRFPGAVRLEYRVDTQDEWQVTELEYVADAPMDEVRTFYRDALAENGWSLAELQYGLGEWVYYVTMDTSVAVIELEPRQELLEIELELRAPAPAEGSGPQP